MQYRVTSAQIRSMLDKVLRNLHGRERYRRYRKKKMSKSVVHVDDEDSDSE